MSGRKTAYVKGEIFEVYGEGLCYASVCSNLPADEVEFRMKHRATGLATNHWELSKEKFKDGEPNPSKCEDHTDCKHYLFEC